MILIGLGLFIYPFEAQITRAFYLLLNGFFGTVAYIFHPGLLILLGLWLCRKKIWGSKGLVLEPLPIYLVGVLVFGYAVSSIVQQAPLFWSFQLIQLTFLGLALGFALASSENLFKFSVKFFLRGLSFWNIVGVIAYAHMNYYLHTHGLFRYSSVENLLIFGRYPGAWVLDMNNIWFFKVTTNLNKGTNLIFLGLMLVVYMYQRKFLSKTESKFHFVISLVAVFIYFSRGAFLMCIFSALAILCYDRFVIKNKALQLTQLKKVAFLLTIPFLLSISTSEFRKHWMNLNTFQGRIQMWGSALEVKGEGDEEIRERFRQESKTKLAIFGYGPTQYGIVRGLGRDASTQNLFLDVWSEGGIISFAALILLFAVTLKNIVWRMRLAAVRDERESLIFCLLGVTSIIVLGFREFNFTYMYATNVYGLIGGMLMMPPRKS